MSSLSSLCLMPSFATFSKRESHRNSLNVTRRDFPPKPPCKERKPPRHFNLGCQLKFSNQLKVTFLIAIFKSDFHIAFEDNTKESMILHSARQEIQSSSIESFKVDVSLVVLINLKDIIRCSQTYFSKVSY